MADTKTAMKPLVIGGKAVEPGQRVILDLPLSRLADHTPMQMRVEIVRGKKQGPVLFVSAAIHGDEIIGVEIIRRLARLPLLERLSGTLILVPVVNTYGFNALSRYLPDRRDLNRSFPGSPRGSLAGQLAHTFSREIVAKSGYGIDLHSGAIHRANMPQIRAGLSNPTVAAMAKAFGAPIMLNSDLRDGSLREAAQEMGCNMLLFEAGEALRFDESATRIGVRGVLGVMRYLKMLPRAKGTAAPGEAILAEGSHWERAPMGGLMRALRALGEGVEKGELLAVVSDPLGHESIDIRARSGGIVIGRTNLPIVNRGDAVFHIAEVDSADVAEARASAIELDADQDPLFDEGEII